MAVKAIMFEIVWPFYVKGVFYILFSKISMFPDFIWYMVKEEKFETNLEGHKYLPMHACTFN